MKRNIPNVLVWAMAAVWLWSGVVPVVFETQLSLSLLSQVGIGSLKVQWLLLASSSLLDAAFGVLCFTRLRFQAAFWLAQLAAVALYSAIIAFRMPEMWLHPFAPWVKNIPIMAVLLLLYRECKNI